MCIGLTFGHFRVSEKDPVFNASFTHTMTVSKTKSYFLKKKVVISAGKGFLMSRSFTILFMVSVKQKFAFNFDFFLYYFHTSVKGKLFSNGVNSVITR